MAFCQIVLYIFVYYVRAAVTVEEPELWSDVRQFPNGFLFGSASAAYQIEGAWNEDGKTQSIYDLDTHRIPSAIRGNATGDIAADSYHLYKRDVEMLRELGVDFYRFSVAWTRILPTSFPDKINQAGVDYYNNLIDELIKYNIQPMITLYHWDLPQTLHIMGGWTNPNIVDWFGDYARIVFKLFGDRVKFWITINEPFLICHYGYGAQMAAPRINIPGIPEYLCNKYLLMAHAKAYHIYDEEFRDSQGGKICISLNTEWLEPESEIYSAAAKEALMFSFDIHAHPIFSESGDWPPILKEKIARKSAEQGFFRSRLPDFTPEEVNYLQGTSDLLGLNHYYTYYVNMNQTAISQFKVPSMDDDIGANVYLDDDEKFNEYSFTTYEPKGFYKLLAHIREEYGNPPVLITENGYGSFNDSLDDDDRVTYFRGNLNAMLDAIDDGSNVIGYTAWSLMDNFEWIRGYAAGFGLYDVDYSSPMRTRTPRRSAFVLKEIVRSRALDPTYQPCTNVMTIDEGH